MRYLGLLLLFAYAALYIPVYWEWIRPLRTRWLRWTGILILLSLIPLPHVAWQASHAEKWVLSYSAGAIAYILLAPLLWHGCIWLLLRGINLVLWILPGFFPRTRIHPMGRCIFRGLLAGLLLLVIIASTIETHWLHVQPVVIQTPLVPPGSPGISIVQVSDMHLDAYPWSRKSAPVIRVIKKLNPDLVVSTGDFLDAPAEWLSAQAEEWAALRPPFGKYAVLGNHEGYKPLRNALAFHEAAGFQLLRTEMAQPLPWLTLLGVDDPAVRREAADAPPPREEDIPIIPLVELDGIPDVRILLKHQPVVTPWSVQNVHLQLSGHTHAGQIFPFHLLVKLAYPFFRGNYFIPPHFLLHVSRGTGYWGPPFRFLAPPEITHITLLPLLPQDGPTP